MTGGSCVGFTRLLIGWEAYFEEEIYFGIIDFNIDYNEHCYSIGSGWRKTEY